MEVCADGQWGSVCDSSWTVTDAAVVCRQIGQYSSGKITRCIKGIGFQIQNVMIMQSTLVLTCYFKEKLLYTM